MTLLAPYFYSWSLNNPAYKANSLCVARKRCGLACATFAFVLSGSFGVRAGSGKVCPELQQSLPDINAYCKAGGSLIISFGGASGPYLEDAIEDPKALFAVWDEIAMATGSTSFDFDVEGAYIEKRAQNNVRIDALKLFQKKYPNSYLSYTLAVMPPDAHGNESLGAPQITLLKSTIAAGVKISLVNLMTMDFGQPAATLDMGKRSIACAESVHKQLSKLYPTLQSKNIYGMIGVTPMAGENDDHSIFTEDDARAVSKYAGEKGIGLLSYWALQRDQVGKGELALYSKVNSADFSFFKAFSSGLTLPSAILQPILQPTVEPIPETKPGKKDSAIVPWDEWVKYVSGQQVSYEGHIYTCITGHTSQPDWKPAGTLALWKA